MDGFRGVELNEKIEKGCKKDLWEPSKQEKYETPKDGGNGRQRKTRSKGIRNAKKEK